MAPSTTRPRPYRSPRRDEQAARTRAAVLAAATALFLERGWAATSMRGVAGRAEVSVATVELLFGTKAALLKSAIDVAIAGDDVPVPVLERGWAGRAAAAPDPATFLARVAEVLAAAQQRSAGLVLAVFEGAPGDPRLADLAGQLRDQRRRTASWVASTLATKQPLRSGCAGEVAVETLWVLMDPAVFHRLVRGCSWTVAAYRDWFAASARHLLLPDPPASEGATR